MVVCQSVSQSVSILQCGALGKAQQGSPLALQSHRLVSQNLSAPLTTVILTVTTYTPSQDNQSGDHF